MLMACLSCILANASPIEGYWRGIIKSKTGKVYKGKARLPMVNDCICEAMLEYLL